MNCLRNGAVGVLLLTGWGIAASEEVSYSHLELGHETTDLTREDDGRYNLKSLGVAASWEAVSHLALLAEGKRTTQADLEFNSFKAGATTFWSMSGIADFYATAAYNFGTELVDLGIGFRARPARVVEFNVYLGSDSFERREHVVTQALALELGLRCYLTRTLALGFDFQKFGPDDEGNVTRVSIRYDFGHGK